MSFYNTRFNYQTSDECAFAVLRVALRHQAFIQSGGEITTQLLVYGARLMEDLVRFQDSLIGLN